MAFVDTVVITGRGLQEVKEVLASKVKKQIR
jgi:hypothetical protein